MDVGSVAEQHFQSLICHRCRSAIFGPRRFKVGWTGGEDRTIFEYETVRQLVEQSAQGGCNWCSLTLCNPHAWEDVGTTDAVSIRLRSGNPAHSYHPVGSNRYELLVNGWALHLTAFTDGSDPTSRLVTSRQIKHEVGAADAFEQARTWLEECEHHLDCPRRNKQKFPARLIDVGLPGQQIVPRVVELKDEIGNYAALSYCWGSKQTCILKLDSLESFKRQLPLMSIPQTIRDAIKCTREIGVKYLWVDAFCVIQDSAEDKARELASMRKIYRGAYITIVAASAPDAWKGFLEDRPQPQLSFKIPAWTPDGTCGVVSLRPEGWYGYEDEPVSCRAWTLEERLLSPRLLMYASHTLQWHCQLETKNYGNSLHIPAGLTDFSLPVSFTRQDHRNLEGSDATMHAFKTELKAWMSVISDYSRRLCTYPEDRLRAIGGLAEEYHLRFGFEYLAGLWNGPWLCTLLLWQPSEYAVPNDPIYLAPTWSWASVNSAVSYRYSLYEDQFKWHNVELVEAYIAWKSPHFRFGQITDGFLRLRGHLKEAWFEPPQYLDWVIDGTKVETGINAAMDQRTQGESVTCLAIRETELIEEENTLKIIDGLLLRMEPHTGDYKRIGCFFGAGVHDFATTPRSFIKLV